VTPVFLGVGSNIDRRANICAGLDVLRAELGLKRTSSVYESEAIGFDGPSFLNLAVELDVRLGLEELARFLRQLEYRMGRPRNASRFSSRTLDIDILTYGTLTGRVDGVELPRAELLENAFVLAPMAELAPGDQHPLAGKSYRSLWSELGSQMQPVQRVDFDCRGWSLPWAG
jgi:2-amino-4-hydroxy-6-hydroxymethyldihydropteridine diphosphokinase